MIEPADVYVSTSMCLYHSASLTEVSLVYLILGYLLMAQIVCSCAPSQWC